MERLAILVSAAALAVVGCSENMKMNNPFEKKAATSTAPAAPAKANYFEAKQDGKTYVLASPEAMAAVNQGQAANVKPVQLDNGETIYVENTDFTNINRLLADYKKNHSL
jgi:hypothetical protein